MLLLTPSVSGLFKWRFEPEVILLAVGWYLRFSLSYRDVEDLLAERGLLVDHVTVWRWVQRYAPEMERRLRSRRKPTNDSWRVDETYVRVKGKWVYLYRAVDSSSATIDFLLSAERFLAKALGAFRFVSSKPNKKEKAKLLWHFCASAESGEFHSALRILIGARVPW
jgi:transposase, IS6 family